MAKAFIWGATTDQPIEMRSLVIVAAFGLTGLAAVESFRWVDQKVPTPPPPPLPVIPTPSAAPTPQPTAHDSKPAPPKPEPRELKLRFLYTKEPTLLIDNPTDSIVRDIKWMVILWNRDLPDRLDPLPIPVSFFDWLRPHTTGGPQNLFGSPAVASLLKPGDHLMGSAAVICPECTRGRTYIVSITFGQGGWYSEVEGNNSGNAVIPARFDKETRDGYFRLLETMAPNDKRIAIIDAM